MGKIKGIWKKLKYWQKFGIIFGVFHILFLTLVIFLSYLERGSGLGMLIIIPEFIPNYIVYMVYLLLNSQINLWGLFINPYLSYYFVGTIIYSLLGMLFGFFIDQTIKLLRGEKK